MSATGRTSSLVPATVGLCSAVQSFINGTIEAVFRAIGHVSVNPGAIKGQFGFFGPILAGIAQVGAAVINAGVDFVHFVMVNGAQVATGALTAAMTAAAGLVATVAAVATELVPWTGQVNGVPNPTSKGVAAGVPGDFVLTATAPGSDLRWPGVHRRLRQYVQHPAPFAGAERRRGPMGHLSSATGRAHICRRRQREPGQKRHRPPPLRDVDRTSGPCCPRPARDRPVRVIATVHRKDLDQLRDKLLQPLLSSLPQIIQSTIGALLKPRIDAMLAAAASKVATIQDVQARAVEAVYYHTPNNNGGTSGTTGAGYALASGSPEVSIFIEPEFLTYVRWLTDTERRIPSPQVQGQFSLRQNRIDVHILQAKVGIPSLPSCESAYLARVSRIADSRSIAAAPSHVVRYAREPAISGDRLASYWGRSG